MLTCWLMPPGFFRDLQTVCSKMFTHLQFKWSNNSSFFSVLLLIYSCSDWPELHIQAELSTDFFPVTEWTFNPSFFFSVKPKIPAHKTAGHGNSRPIKFQSGCWCSRVILAISTVRKCSVWKQTRRLFFFFLKTTRFHPAMVRQHRQFLQSFPWACVSLENLILNRSQSLEIVFGLGDRGTYTQVNS